MNLNLVYDDKYELHVDNSPWLKDSTYVKIIILPQGYSKQYWICNFIANIDETDETNEKQIWKESKFNHPLKEKLRGRIEKSNNKLTRLNKFNKGFLIDKKTTEFWTLFEFIKVWTSETLSNLLTKNKNKIANKLKKSNNKSVSSSKSKIFDKPKSKCH